MEGGRTAQCPGCGAPIAWSLGASHALICSYCRFSVLRTDRNPTSLGKVADLVPTAATLAVGDVGLLGKERFRVLGRLQLDHGRGPWDEWYVAFDNDRWGFLAQAQGRWYLTFAQDASAVPAWDALLPGQQTRLPSSAATEWTVSERGGSALVSAEGELPFPAIPLSSGRYVDLESAGDGFATIDYGDGSADPKLYLGRRFAGDAVAVQTQAPGPRPTERVSVEKLSCPNCGGPIALFVPESERVGCTSCGALLDHKHGALALLHQFERAHYTPFAPFGSEAKLFGARRMLIGMMQRSVNVDGEIFSWREYLLHADDGYAWLVEDNGHFMFVRPISAGAVHGIGSSVEYEGRRYKRFASGAPTVDFVLGEFYWKVQAGDLATTTDYIAPPRILSLEESDGEINWSEGEYVPAQVLTKAFGLKGPLPRAEGVAPCQPNPHALRGSALVFAFLALLLAASSAAFELANDTRVVIDQTITMPPSDAAIKAGLPRPLPQFLETFEIEDGPTSLALSIESSLESGYTAVAASLLNETTGEVAEADLLAEYYHGVTDGEAWSEGERAATEYFGKLNAGRYVLRLDTSWDAWGIFVTTMPTVRLRVVEGERSPGLCIGAWILIALPFLFRLLRNRLFEARRNENANS